MSLSTHLRSKGVLKLYSRVVVRVRVRVSARGVLGSVLGLGPFLRNNKG